MNIIKNVFLNFLKIIPTNPSLKYTVDQNRSIKVKNNEKRANIYKTISIMVVISLLIFKVVDVVSSKKLFTTISNRSIKKTRKSLCIGPSFYYDLLIIN